MKLIDYIKNIRNVYVIKQVKRIKVPNFKPSPIVRQNIVFSGRVQNVGFRLEVCELSKRLKLTGWVINRKDKSVEAEIQGEIEKINYLILYMQDLIRASVRDVKINERAIIVGDRYFVMLED